MFWNRILSLYEVSLGLAPLYRSAAVGYYESEVEEMISNWDHVHGRIPTPGELGRMLQRHGTYYGAASKQQPCYARYRRHEG